MRYDASSKETIFWHLNVIGTDVIAIFVIHYSFIEALEWLKPQD